MEDTFSVGIRLWHTNTASSTINELSLCLTLSVDCLKSKLLVTTHRECGSDRMLQILLLIPFENTEDDFMVVTVHQ